MAYKPKIEKEPKIDTSSLEFMEVSPVDETNLLQAAMVHSISWKESHRAFCTPDSIELHTPDRQRDYLNGKMKKGAKIYSLIIDEKPIGIVSVTNSLIEDLYVLPNLQNMKKLLDA